MPKYSIGIDYGTLSARALMVDIADGRELGSTAFDYPHAVISDRLPESGAQLPPDWALQHPQDYLDALSATVPALLRKTGVEPTDVVGVAIDFTACTVLPVYADGTPLCFADKYRGNPHAYIKLWKHHAAQSHANRLNEAAEKAGEAWLPRYGGKISSEWLLPKVWQVLDEAPEIYADAAHFVEGTDWVTWQLTGVQSRAACTAGYKAIWHKRDGYPSGEFLKSLDPRLENLVADKLSCPVTPMGSLAGYVNEAASRLTGLAVGTAVAVGNVDAHVTVPAVGISQTGDMLAIMGTSTCHMLLSEREMIVPGMCGVVEDGILPGFFGYEAGQSCVGDHFAWFAENFADEADAKAKGFPNAIAMLTDEAAKLKVGESGLLALDWWNGNRSVLVDVDLTGMFLGMTLATRPAEMFRALVEATAFGTRKIIESFRESGVPVERFFAAGGIAQKNAFVMQIYADVINMPIRIAGSTEAPALGSAIFGAAAAGYEKSGYRTIAEASAAMSSLSDRVYTPDPANAALYDKLYAEYKLLHDYFGRGANDVMKRLKDIKKGTR